jgi:hypothetical protein
MAGMSISKLFTEHPAAVGESYFGHLLAASSFGVRMMFAGFACMVHAVLPFVFVDTGSRAVAELHEHLAARRNPAQAPPRQLRADLLNP